MPEDTNSHLRFAGFNFFGSSAYSHVNGCVPNLIAAYVDYETFRIVPRIPTKDVRPTKLELRVLSALWRTGGGTVRQIHETLESDESIGYTTVLKMLQITS